MQKFLPVLFHILLAAGPILVSVAMHNYAQAASGAYGLIESILATHGLLLAGAGSAVGAAVVHHKIASSAAAALPPVVQGASTDRTHLLDLLWANLGRDATDGEIKAMRDLDPNDPKLAGSAQ